MRLTGKTSIITGGGRGIGRAISLAFASKGANVAVVDLDMEAAQQTVRDADQHGVQCVAVRADASRDADVRRTVDGTLERFGAIDILVNNAGICSTKPTEECTEEEWDRMFAVNVKSVFLYSKAVMPHMKKRRYGKIINMASVAGKTGGWAIGPHYAASKSAVISLTKSLARELAPFGVNVNGLAPGQVETDMVKGHINLSDRVPLGRRGTPEEVAACAVFLASDESRYVVGEIMDVNGGMLMDD